MHSSSPSTAPDALLVEPNLGLVLRLGVAPRPQPVDARVVHERRRLDEQRYGAAELDDAALYLLQQVGTARRVLHLSGLRINQPVQFRVVDAGDVGVALAVVGGIKERVRAVDVRATG